MAGHMSGAPSLMRTAYDLFRPLDEPDIVCHRGAPLRITGRTYEPVATLARQAWLQNGGLVRL